MEKVIISNPKRYESIKREFTKDGPKNVHILSDFDKTITKAYIYGIKIPSIISELRNGNYLSEEYAKKAQELFNKYHPYEEDKSLTESERKEKMHEWYSKHFDLLIKEKLNKKDLEKVVKSGNVQLRKGIEKFVKILEEKNIPLIILSASGIGDSIPLYLKENKINYKNIHVISNFYEWDSEGKAIDVKKPIIHSANKEETTLENLPIYSELLKRKNIILLGDSKDDSKMASRFPYENILKIGFLNDRIEQKLEEYRNRYDIIIPKDGTLDFLNELLEEIK